MLPEYLSCDQIRNVDRFAIENIGIPGLVLMENAARGCVDLLVDFGISGSVVVVCGKGNNGGDGFAMVRLLHVRGYSASAWVLGDPSQLKGDAAANYQILKKTAPDQIFNVDLNHEEFEQQLNDSQTEWIVDAMLGTGTKGTIREPFASVINLINTSNKRVFAVDIPSGLDTDSGDSLGSTVLAEVTGTFVALKTGFRNDSAQKYLGKVKVLDIGVPASVVADSLQSPS